MATLYKHGKTLIEATRKTTNRGAYKIKRMEDNTLLVKHDHLGAKWKLLRTTPQICFFDVVTIEDKHFCALMESIFN